MRRGLSVSPKARDSLLKRTSRRRGKSWWVVAVVVGSGINKSCEALVLTQTGQARKKVASTTRRVVRMSAMEKKVLVGLVGATGAVGKELLGVLEEREFPLKDAPALFGSSGGKKVETKKWGSLSVEKFEVEKLKGYDVCFLAASGDFAKEFARKIAQVLNEGGVVVDNSSALRLQEDVPLVVPEVNGKLCKTSKLIANPNCTTAIAMMALAPLFAAFGLKKVIVSTYQAASGAGAAGMQELKDGVKLLAENDSMVKTDGCFDSEKKFPNKVFAHPLPFNVVPHIDVFQDNLYTKEEMKVTWETKKILGFDPMDDTSEDCPKISCTAVRIPTLRAHSEAITVETRDPVDVSKARQLLADAPGIRLLDQPSDNLYPMPLSATGAYDVEVGRVRANPVFGDYGLDFFVCGDQLLRGAALNAVLIAEKAIE